MALTIPAGASASTVTCAGHLEPNENPAITVSHALAYTVHCSEDMSAMSMTFSRSISYFDPAPVVFDGDEPAPDDSMGCEGDFPGWGFGCHGSVAATHSVEGTVAPEKNACPKSKKKRRSRKPFDGWVTATTTQLDKDGNPFTTSSQPFHLYGPKCPKAARHHRHG